MATKIQPFQENRPWGYFRQFCENTSATVKIIYINPNETLSLQSHAKREEFWHVISGSGLAEVAGDKREVKTEDEIAIPTGAKHRLSAGSEGMEILEISLGDFDENDITRYEDKYGRV